MNCEEARVILEENAKDAAVQAHLKDCAECREYATQMSADDAVLSRALGRSPDEARFQTVKARVMREVAARAISFSGSRKWAWIAASAAAVVLLVSGAVYFNTVRPSPRENMLQALATLQEKVRDRQLLDEVEQLQIAFSDAGDDDAKSVAEDVELYVERLMAADSSHPEQTREILRGIRNAGIAARLKQLRESVGEDAPVPVVNSLELALSTLNEAVRLADAGGEINAH
jgi:predicted anti-sigma-YlaC factor YlaD